MLYVPSASKIAPVETTLYVAFFEAEGTYSINVTATGYDNLVFQYEKKEPVKEDNTDIAGTKATIKGITYKVVKNNKGVYSATVTGAKNKNIKTITIPATVKIENETLKVTVINKNAIKILSKFTFSFLVSFN